MKDFFSFDKHYEYPKDELISKICLRFLGPTIGFLEGHDWKVRRTILTKLFTFDFLKEQT
jgi:hypothetical protein